MTLKLNHMGDIAITTLESVPSVRRKISRTGKLSGLSEVDASRLATSISEICRVLISRHPNTSIGVYTLGDELVDGIALSLPEVVSDMPAFKISAGFDRMQTILESDTTRLLALKLLSKSGPKIGGREFLRIQELLSQLSREELLGEVQAKNKELEAHQKNLERKVAERTASLSEANEELAVARERAEEATKAKAAFLAAMSHEIRTPMNGVIGMVDILNKTKLDDDQIQMVRTVKDSAYALLTIINDILDFSKIEAGKLELEAVPLSVRDVLEGVAETLGPNTYKKGIKLNIHVDPNIPDAVLGDEVRIRQILFNIAGNAVKFTETGRVLMRAFHVPVDQPGKTGIRFDIIDSGIGISKEAQADLFTEFSQAESSTTRRFGGTGLGLSICQRLTEMMGGDISVESELGEGSTFSVDLTLPIAEEHDIEDEAQDLSEVRVLFVTDLVDEGELDATYLRRWQAEVTVTDDLAGVFNTASEGASASEPYGVIVFGSALGIADVAKQIELIQDNSAIKQTGFVQLTESRVSSDRQEIRNLVYVESDPIRRLPFVRGVAVAAGRASPEIEMETSEASDTIIAAPTVEEAEAAGTLILVAEDNLTNQMVIRRQLNMLGYAVEMADDGRQALDRLNSKDYGILLTDCHMPEMDGFELTRRVREREANGHQRIPVVAITASVMESEINNCFESGMDDYLAKPLEMPKLKSALEKWMPDIVREVYDDVAVMDQTDGDPSERTTSNASSGDFQDGNSKSDTAVEEQILDPTALKDVFGDDDETFKEILNDFVEPASDNVDEIMAAYQSKSPADVSAAAHKLKSSSRAVGASKLADLCLALETAGHEDDWSAIEDAAPKLPETLKQVTQFISRL